MSDEVIFQNQMYTVRLNDDCDGYVVVNRQNGIYEAHEDFLPDAILAAIEGQARLKWYEEVAAAQAAQDEDDGEELQIEVELDERTIN